MDITELLAFSAKEGASDLHISAGLPPIIRIDADVRRINLPPMEHRQVHSLIYEIMNDKQRRDFEEFLETDFSFDVPGIARFRVNVFNQNRGAAAVFRTIPSKVLTLEQLGMGDIFKKLSLMSRGLVLVTGPTGSGKSTTLAAMVDYVNENRYDHILTIEDPIEFVHQSKKCLINQREVHRDTHGFSEALRSALREDPDVVLVGELRDFETVSSALTAAETGHLVLATLHTNDALSTVHRLSDMGIAPYLLGPALRCIVGQRLVPQVCGDCAEPVNPPPDLLQEFGVSKATDMSGFRQGTGCQVCRNRGKVGRIAIHEVLTITPAIASAISRQVNEDQLQELAEEAGYVRMLQDGLEKAKAGLVTLEDVVAAARSE